MPTRIPEDVVTEIRERVNIVDVISPYVPLKKQGRNLFGVCPFHEERTPSFSVNEDKQIFHCFSCGRGGNVFSFVMDIDQVSFPQAVAKVAPLAGIDIDDKYLNNESAQPVDERTQALRELYQDATKLYHHLLVNTQAGESALNYLHERGLDDATIDAFMLGYAPGNDFLLDYFQNKKVDYQLLRTSELFVVWDDGTLHDRFSDRVLFTIRDQYGHPIAFSGRRLSADDTQPKYVNSPESLLFDKSNELFNLDLARDSIKKSHDVILFEGFMDVIAAFQAGVKNSVASMGTSLTIDQVRQLNRLADNITIAYDSDAAGQNATKRALDLIQQNSQMTPVVAHIPDNQDPDEYLRSHDAAALNDVLAHHHENPIAFNLRFLRQDRDFSNQNEVFDYIDQALHLIASVDEAVVRENYLRQLSDDFNISFDALTDQIRPMLMQRQATRQSTPVPQQAAPTYVDGLVEPPEAPAFPVPDDDLNRVEQAERMLLAWMLRDNDVWLEVTQQPDFTFSDVSYETLYMLATGYRESHQLTTIDNLNDFMDYVQKPELIRILAAIQDIPDELFEDREHVKAYMQVMMQEEPLETQIKKLTQQLAEAKSMHNDSEIAQKSVEIINLLRKQQALREQGDR
ncbi:DNA primase [Weissella viridescens]|uniref:DNA primase n=1 Tax=Weissella viridescens TaxID=1629 RepID=UPI001D0931E9|nr:DNA primase [Weissella viridescens]MCB6839613.1 DNA primase [Weissella viridescens]MCB6846344.1 DNA primase [Weissella viridescens]